MAGARLRRRERPRRRRRRGERRTRGAHPGPRRRADQRRRLFAQPRDARALAAQAERVAMDQCEPRRHRRDDRGGDAARRRGRLHGRGVVGHHLARPRTRRCPRAAVQSRRHADSVHAPPRPVVAAPRSWSTRTASASATSRAPTWRSASACTRGTSRPVAAVPSWVILDSRHRDNYPWGTAQPGQDAAVLARQRLHEEGRLARGTGATVRHRRGRARGRVAEIQRLSAAPASIPSSVAAVARSIARTATRRSSRTRTSARSSRAPFYAVRDVSRATSARPAASSPTSTRACCARTAR